MEVSRELITPQKAKEYLQTNTSNNRPAKEKHIRHLASSMIQGKWKSNGDTIRFSVGGKLLDGQHRLNAVVRSGCTIEMLVVRGVEDEAFSTIDLMGASRSVGDVFSIEGVSNAKHAAAAVQAVLRYLGGSPTLHTDCWFVTPEQRLQFFRKQNVGVFVGALNSISAKELRGVIAPSYVNAAAFLYSQSQGTEKSLDVFRSFIVGEMNRDSPLFLLRAQLVRNALSRSPLPNNVRWWWTVNALNHDISGVKTKLLKFTKPKPMIGVDHNQLMSDFGLTDEEKQLSNFS